ncbi:uncharacterized protein BDV17DRAFT_235051 [Aspergillus undulatus]|uniref:uncharacterized protein n=1 Tax=Aspergillus undulatus TaxID=1810928 RepID=UPI003CCC9F78
MEELNGRWLMEKSLSTSMDAMLKLQGIGWTLRKAIGLATIRLTISIHPGDKPTPTEKESAPSAPYIDVTAALTGGLANTHERWMLDWIPADQKDYVLGPCEKQSRFVHGVQDADGNMYPEFEMETHVSDERAKRYLRGEINENGSAAKWSLAMTEGEEHTWVHTFMRNKEVGWTVEQIWAVEEIDGKRYHTRRIVTAKNGEYVLGKIIYSSIPA